MNVVSVRINGMEYNLKGDEQAEYLLKVAAYVDRKVKDIMDKNYMLNTSSASVLSAINIVDDLFKSQRECKRLSDYSSEMENKDKLNEGQIEELKRQLKHLELNNSELQQRIKESISKEVFSEKEDELEKVKKEFDLMEDAAQKYVEKNSILKAENKELKFQLHSSKYKIMDLQNKLMESQINFVKEKKLNNGPLIKPER
jgi:cell division protein ZapA